MSLLTNTCTGDEEVRRKKERSVYRMSARGQVVTGRGGQRVRRGIVINRPCITSMRELILAEMFRGTQVA